MDKGFIFLHRKFLKWEWYSNVNDRLVFIHCLLSANWEDGWFEGKKIPRGSFATSYKNLAKEIGISVQSLRTSLEHLKSTNNITHETNRQFSIITINNYNKYQLDNTQVNKRLTNDQQTTNNNIINNNKLINKESISKDIPKKVFSKPTLQEISDYCLERNNGINPNKFYDFYESKNWMIGKNKMKDWKACVRTWEQHESKQDNSKLPDWWDKDFKERERTDEDERELQELIRGY
jgi:hypothetical protein